MNIDIGHKIETAAMTTAQKAARQTQLFCYITGCIIKQFQIFEQLVQAAEDFSLKHLILELLQ